MQDFVLISRRQLGFGNEVFRLDEVTQGIHEHADGQRCIQAEGLVRHQSIRCMLVEVARNGRYELVLAHQDGHIVHLHALLNHALHLLGKQLHGLVLIVSLVLAWCLDEGHLYRTLSILSVDFLFYIGIGTLQLITFLALFGLVSFVQNLAGVCKYFVIETYDVLLASSIYFQCVFIDREGSDTVLQSVQDTPVSASPSVDALLHIAHNEGIRPLRKPFEQEQLEVTPLHARCILELVNHHVADVRANLLEHERRVALTHDVV